MINSGGHETTLFPFKEGVAAIIQRNGHEHNTIQYAKDWINFEVASNVELLPLAAGPYVPDAFSDTKYGKGITWGISHFIMEGPDKKNNQSVLTRFDCDLSLDVHDPEMKKHYTLYGSEIHYQQGGLSAQQLKRIKEQNDQLVK